MEDRVLYYLVSILLGLIPEVLYFTLSLIYIKDLKEKKIRLFFLIGIVYFICLIIQRLVTLYYIALMVLIYIILKVLYKSKVQIIDVFIISIMCLWITILSFISILCFTDNYSNYWIIYTINRILLFLPFIFKNKFNNMYKSYCKLWNRNDKEKRPIKSITLRNISLIILNGFILFMNVTIINMINYMKIGMG